MARMPQRRSLESRYPWALSGSVAGSADGEDGAVILEPRA